MEKKRALLKGNLDENLKLRREEIENRLAQNEQSREQDVLRMKKRDVSVMKSVIDASLNEERRIQASLEEAAQKLLVVQKALHDEQEFDAKSKRCVDVQKFSLEKFRLQLQRLGQKKEDIEKKIRDIGSVPEDAFGKYSDRSTRVRMHWTSGIAELIAGALRYVEACQSIAV